MKSYSVILATLACLSIDVSHQAFCTPTAQVNSVAPSNITVSGEFSVTAQTVATNGENDPQNTIYLALSSTDATGGIDGSYYYSGPLLSNQTLTLTPVIALNATSLVSGAHYVTAEIDLSTGQTSSLGSTYNIGVSSGPAGPAGPGN
jgi:hypothetical protein